MKHILIGIMFLFSVQSFAQCEVDEVDQDDGVTVYYSGWENLFTYAGINNNGDYSEGAFAVYARIVGINENKSAWDIEIITKVIGFREIIPRRITFNTQTSSVVLDSESAYTSGDYKIYEYSINANELQLLQRPITSMKLTDTRTNQEISSKLEYHSILAEQIKCIKAY